MDMHHWFCQISSIASTWQKKALEFDEFEKLSFWILAISPLES